MYTVSDTSMYHIYFGCYICIANRLNNRYYNDSIWNKNEKYLSQAYIAGIEYLLEVISSEISVICNSVNPDAKAHQERWLSRYISDSYMSV